MKIYETYIALQDSFQYREAGDEERANACLFDVMDDLWGEMSGAEREQATSRGEALQKELDL